MREAASKSWRAAVSRSCCNSARPRRNKVSACLGSLAARRSRRRCNKGNPKRGRAMRSTPRIALLLELQPQRELNVALAAGRRAGNLAENLVLPITVGHIELRCVGDVEALGPELESESLSDADILEK